jgi:predicted  nucleic acid-binding Zn-ribbon protein
VSEGSGGTGGSELRALIDVQDHDTALDQLRHRRAHLPERLALADIESRLAGLDVALLDARTRLDEVVGRQSALEADIAGAEARIGEIEKRLYGGTVSASRDLTAMSEEVDHLKKRRSSIEDSVLEVMEEREPIDAEVDRLVAERAQLEGDAAVGRDALAVAEAAVDAEIEAAVAERAAAAQALSPELVKTYEALRARLGGVGAARLAGSSCSGCHLTLPATELDRIKRASPDALVFCEQCGRILVH